MNHTEEQLNRYFKSRGGYKSAMEREETWTEDMVCNKIASYLKENRPNVLFFFDMSGYQLSITSAVKAKHQRADAFRVPDLMVIEKSHSYSALFLEVKTKKVKLFKKDGSFVADKHLNEQRSTLLKLREKGYCADFSLGYMDTIKKINDYLDTGKIAYTL
jgi:hypothetical protein